MRKKETARKIEQVAFLMVMSSLIIQNLPLRKYLKTFQQKMLHKSNQNFLSQTNSSILHKIIVQQQIMMGGVTELNFHIFII